MTRATDYQVILNKHLKDPKQAAAYLNAAIEEGDVDLFILALRNVAEAKGTELTSFSQAHPSLEIQKILRLLSDTGLVFTTREDQRAS
jgi:DNA-binding phage protein